uniref:Uncharacterized protein n=1 Tax=Octopus bimaculoides TaxID=37653 RepID=A0A0L8FUC5_OCTBM
MKEVIHVCLMTMIKNNYKKQVLFNLHLKLLHIFFKIYTQMYIYFQAFSSQSTYIEFITIGFSRAVHLINPNIYSS